MKTTQEPGEFLSLTRIPEGQYPCANWYQLFRRRGWLTVESRKANKVIMWTTGKETHSRAFGVSATSIELTPEGNLEAYYKSFISMWIMWGYGRGDDEQRQEGLKEARWMMGILENYIPSNTTNSVPKHTNENNT